MQTGMTTLLENHMSHVQQHLETLATQGQVSHSDALNARRDIRTRDIKREDKAVRKAEKDAIREQSAAGVSARTPRKTRSSKTSRV